MDVFMPIMNGIEATVQIRQNSDLRSEKQPYICALTANAMSGDRDVCLQSGMNAYLPKPVTLTAIIAQLKMAWKYCSQT